MENIRSRFAYDHRGEGCVVDERISDKDAQILRKLASVVAEIAARPEQAEKAKLWTAHNDLKTTRPVVFCDPDCGWMEIVRDSDLVCEGEMARCWERDLRKKIFWGNEIKDDAVIDNIFHVRYAYSSNGWGLESNYEHTDKHLGASHIKDVIEDYDKNFDKIHFPTYTVDRVNSEILFSEAQRVFEGLLTVERYHIWWWSYGMTRQFVDLRGMEDFMVDMIAEPDWFRRMMEMLTDGVLAQLDYFEKEGFLTQNIGNRYLASGGLGYTDQIKPVPAGTKVTQKDMWGFVESQECSSVSPDMYGELVFPHHKRICERFAMTQTGCCEAYDPVWKYTKQLPHLRRVSCSPWSDYSTIPANLGKNYVASIKLMPTPLSTPKMDEAAARSDLRRALENSVGCVPELVMKDNHTLGNNPQNAIRWVEIAREEIDRVSGI